MSKLLRTLLVVTIGLWALVMSGCGELNKEEVETTEEKEPAVAGEQSKVNCPEVGSRAGQQAPDFSLRDLDGNQVQLSAQREKNVVLVVFWATWCGYCRQEIPHLRKLQTEMSDRGVKILAVDIQEPRDKVAAFARKQQINYPVLTDLSGEVAGSYKVRGIPANIVIDRNGCIRYNGNSVHKAMEAIEKALEQTES